MMKFVKNNSFYYLLILMFIIICAKTFIIIRFLKIPSYRINWIESNLSISFLATLILLILFLSYRSFTGFKSIDYLRLRKKNYSLNKLNFRSIVKYLIFVTASLIYPFGGSNKIYLNYERAFFSPSDTLFPFKQNINVGNYFLGLDDNIYFGRADTNWSFLVKELPLRIIYNFAQENTSIRIYLMVITFIACVSFYSIANFLGFNFYVSIFGSVVWALNPQFIHWLIYTPNIAVFIALLPISIKLFLDLLITSKINSFKLRLKTLIIGFAICSDPTFGLILIIVFIIISFIFYRYFNYFKIKYLRTLLINFFPSFSLIIFNYSGTLSSYLIDSYFGNANINPSSLSDTNYTKDLINTLISETDLSALLNGFFGEVEALRNFSTTYWKFSTISMVLIIIYSTISVLRNKNLKLLLLLPAGILGFIVSLGKHLPGNFLIYNYIFNLPIFSIMRYFYKWNIIVYLVILIFALYSLNLLAKNWTNKYSLVSIFTLSFVLIIPSWTYMKEQFSIHKSLNYVKLPSEYFEMSNLINSESDKYRIFYLPLNSWTTPERYTWSPQTGNQTIYPYLANLVGQSNNLRPGSSEQHELTLAITNYLYNKSLGESEKLLQDLGFNYIVFRDDVIKEIVGDGQITKEIIEEKFSKNLDKIIYEKNGYKIYDLRQDGYQNKIFTNASYMYYLNSSNNVFLFSAKNFNYNEIYFQNTNQTRNSYGAMKSLDFRWLNYSGFKILPSIFSNLIAPLNTSCHIDQNNTLNKLDYDSSLLPKLGNCFTFFNYESKPILIFNLVDLVSINIKMMSSIILIITLTRFKEDTYV